MCAISMNSYDWDSSESGGKRPKPTPLPHLRLWLTDNLRRIPKLTVDGVDKREFLISLNERWFQQFLQSPGIQYTSSKLQQGKSQQEKVLY